MISRSSDIRRPDTWPRVLGLALAVLLVLCAPAAARWRPAPHASWQWQLSGPIDQAVRADVFDVDLFETPRRTVAALQARGRRVVCYVSAGSLERWRPDARRLPAAVVGRPLDGWPGERWLDVRRLDVLAPWLRARLDRCAAKGFDGVEPDNVDGYANRTGFPLTAADQLRFNRFLAREAHARGLAIGLKNDLDQAAALAHDFDFAVVEQCFAFRECARTRPFLRAGKPVFAAEYGLPRARFCAQARALGISAIRKRLSLGPWRETC